MAGTVPEFHTLNEFSKIHAEFAQYPGRAAFADASELKPRLLRHHKEEVTGEDKDKSLPLFVDDADQKIAFREVDDDGRVTKWNCFCEKDLRLFLRQGIKAWPEKVKNDMLARPDPRCRFVFLLNADRGKPLQISQACLKRLLSFHQVSPSFLDILEAYRGVWDDESELRFSAFRTSSVLHDPHPATVIDFLERSGRRYQISSNLKVPTSRSGPRRKFYKIRQVALHHQFDVGTGVQLWLVGDPHGLVKERIQKYLPLKGGSTAFRDMRTSFRSSLDIQLEILSWILEEWSGYVKDLHDDIHELTDIIVQDRNRALNEEVGPGVPSQSLPTVSTMQTLADQAGTTLMTLSSNDKIIGLLDHFYKQMLENASFDGPTRKHCERSLGNFHVELTELSAQNVMHMDQIRELRTTVQSRLELLSQRLQQRATGAMSFQANRSANETVVMRVITIITLIYLPPTFTSTLFSMESFKELGVAVWATVCLPLLAVTLTLAYFVRKRSLLAANKKLLAAMKGEDNGKSEDGAERNGPFSDLGGRLEQLMGRLWKSLTSRESGDKPGQAGTDEKGGWGLEMFGDVLGRLWRRRRVTGKDDLEKGSLSPESEPGHPSKTRGKQPGVTTTGDDHAF